VLPDIHVFAPGKDVDGRDKPGHDAPEYPYMLKSSPR
jgi:hypothetical protein